MHAQKRTLCSLPGPTAALFASAQRDIEKLRQAGEPNVPANHEERANRTRSLFVS